MSNIDRSATAVDAVGSQLERRVRPLYPKRGDGDMVMSDLVERLRRRTLVHHGGESKYGYNLTEGDSELHVEAATEIEALRATLAAAQIHRDMAVSLLAEWCVDVDQNGTGWDDWDENYKAAMYRPGPLRELLDKAIEDVRYARRYEL